MNGMKGVCPACGASYYGWALANPDERRCDKCGGALEMRRDTIPAAPGSVLLNALLRDTGSDRDRWEDALITNMQFYLRRN